MNDWTETRLSAEAYNRILGHIMSGKLAAGTVIQEKLLSEELELSRTPMRDALLLLEGEGLLVREGRRVLRVMSMDITRYMENLAIRRLLEGEAASLAAGKVPGAELDAMQAELEGMIAGYRAGSPPERETVRQIDDRLHGAISAAAGNQQLAEIVAGLRLKTHIFDLKNMPERFLDTCQEHLALIEALRPGQPAGRAAEMMDRHIGAIRESIIQRLLPR